MLKTIKTKESYQKSIKRVEDLIDIDPPDDSPEADELEVLSILIEDYERRRFIFDKPDPISAIKFIMDQNNLKQKDLVEIFGTKSRVSEVLTGKRQLNLKMITSLHNAFGIPYEILIGDKSSSKSHKMTMQSQAIN